MNTESIIGQEAKVQASEPDRNGYRKFTHPETGVEYNEPFIAFAVHSDRETGYNPRIFTALVCYHFDYEVAKKAFDDEVKAQKNANNEYSKSVLMT